jgi:hypothetical protein
VAVMLFANKKALKVFEYFKIEKEGSDTVIIGDFADKDFSDWLVMIHATIQKALKTKFFDGRKIEHYLNITFRLGGQRVDIAIIKDGKKGPEELYKELLKYEKTGQ